MIDITRSAVDAAVSRATSPAPAEPLPKPLAATPDPNFIKRSQTATPLQNFDAFVPKETLYKGSQGTPVSQLQMVLTRLGKLTPDQAIAEAGTLGAQTQAALHEFQKEAGVDASMLYGPATRSALKSALNAQAFPEVPSVDLGPGGKGPDVAQLQSALVKTGHMSPKAAEAEHGKFGFRTEAAVRALQREFTVMVTGSYGPATRYTLSQLVERAMGKSSTVNLPQPGVFIDGGWPTDYGLYPFHGKLLDGTPPSEKDVFQGTVGDCWVDSGEGTIAHLSPEELVKLMKDNGNGTFTFTFQRYNAFTQSYQPVKITVDANLYAVEGTHRATGKPYLYPLYDRDHAGAYDQATMRRLFMPLFEKAFAQFRGGSYEKTNGGWSSVLFEAVLGRQGYTSVLNLMKPDEVWSLIQKGLATKTPLAAGTPHAPDNDPAYVNAEIIPGHEYMLLDAKEENGQKMVQVRNPWGVLTSTDTDPAHASHWMSFDSFLQLFRTIDSAPAKGVDIGATDQNSWMP